MTRQSEKPNGGASTKIVRRKLASGEIKEYTYEKRAKKPRQPTGGLRLIFNAYSESPEFKRLCVEWRTRKLWLFNLIETRLGWMTLAELEDRTARGKFYQLRDEFAHLPHRADKMMQSLSSTLEWAYDRGMIGYNHAARIGALAEPRRHVAIYTPEMEATLLDGLPPELRHAYLLGLYTGARRTDLVGLKWRDIRDGWLTFVPSKTSGTTGATVSLPVFALPALTGLLREIPRQGETILLQLDGSPWYPINLSKRWQRQMIRFGWAGMRFHDVRHTTATRLVEAGATEAERGAIMGQAIALGSGVHYVARTKLLSENAYRKWSDFMSASKVLTLGKRDRKTPRITG